MRGCPVDEAEDYYDYKLLPRQLAETTNLLALSFKLLSLRYLPDKHALVTAFMLLLK